MLDEGSLLKDVAASVGTYPREVRRVGWRFLEKGLDGALSEEPRPRQERLLDTRQESAVIAMVCGSPPEGAARWSVRLAAQEAVKRGIVPSVGRETIRIVLCEHDIKPWREKNVVRSGVESRIH